MLDLKNPPAGNQSVMAWAEVMAEISGVECRSYDSINVSSTWELTSVSMRYSQGDGVHTPLDWLVLYPGSVLLYCVLLYYPRHGHVL